MNPHIQTAIAFFGSQSRLASSIGYSQMAVSDWLRGAKRISAEATVAIEAATHGEVSRSDLRPDLWPPDQQQVVGESQ